MLDQLGISMEDWQSAPQAMRTAIAYLWQQNQLLQSRCAVYEIQVQRLEHQIAELETLRAEVAELRERLGKNSQNSSKPPSSDPPSAPRIGKRESSGRKAGGQPGHQGRGRKLAPIEEVDHVIELRPASCGQCGCLLLGDDPEPARHQVSELPPVKAEITEYRRHKLNCLVCGTQTSADWPEEMPTGSFGPRAQAVTAYLTGRLGLSHRDVVEAMAALHGLEMGLGSVAALEQRVSQALAQPVETAQSFVTRELVHYVDETSWPEGKKMNWLWIHATPRVTVFTIKPGRSKEASQEVIGRKFRGTVNSDRYNAYHWVDGTRRQLCWAHLKRDFQAMVERGGKSAEIGEGLLVEVGKLFEAWSQLREGHITRAEFQGLIAPVRRRVGELLRVGSECNQKRTRGVCRSILRLESSLWTFVRVEGVEPTNNNAERPLRRAVIWRRKSFGTKSKLGSQFVERILTTVETLRQQGRDVLDYLTAVCTSMNQSSGSICLLPDTS